MMDPPPRRRPSTICLRLDQQHCAVVGRAGELGARVADLLLVVVEEGGVASNQGFRRLRPVAPRRWPLNVVGNQMAIVDWVAFGDPLVGTNVSVDWTAIERQPDSIAQRTGDAPSAVETLLLLRLDPASPPVYSTATSAVQY